jgi:hypothetical protein
MIAFQPTFRPAIPNIYGASDYREFRDQLFQIDQFLESSGVEKALIDTALARWERQAKQDGMMVAPAQRQRQCQQLHYAFRCNVARQLTGESFRIFSIRLADSSLLQWFTGINGFEQRKAASKSSIERYDKCFEVKEVEQAIRSVICKVINEKDATALLGLDQAVRVDSVFADCTCVKANIHFPVDWVLLRDSARTLIAAIKLIRAQGLNHRMPEPSGFVKRMNQLSIEMPHTRRRKDSKKSRKRVLRSMKKLARTIEKHGHRYRLVLAENREKTQWSQAQTELVLGRIDNVLDKLPQAIRQAHERIIGERRLANHEKILSLYEEDVHVLVRGKVGSDVEFGNGLYLVEQQDGLIVDWEFFKDQPLADTKLVKSSVQRMNQAYGKINIKAFCADRGFDAMANVKVLEHEDVYNAICPRNPQAMAERTQEPRFMQLQNRRAATEARIAIFKNAYLGRPLRSKGFAHKQNTMVWGVFTHNLWVLARLALAQTQERKRAAA